MPIGHTVYSSDSPEEAKRKQEETQQDILQAQGMGRWSADQSRKDSGHTIGDAFKGIDYLYNAQTGTYGSKAKQVPGITPQKPEGMSVFSTQQQDVHDMLLSQWEQIATPNEKFWAQQYPDTYPVAPDMLTDNPLSLKIGGATVQATSQQEMSDLLRFMTDNRDYLPTGSNPVAAPGVQSVEQYKTIVNNTKTLNTPEWQQYRYWIAQKSKLDSYNEQVNVLATRLGVAPEDLYGANGEIKIPDDFQGSEDAFLKSIEKRYPDLYSAKEIQSNLDESYRGWATDTNRRMPEGWKLNTENHHEFNLPNGWIMYQGGLYRDEQGLSYTTQDVISNPELMKRFSEAVTPQLVESFKKEIETQPEIVEHLITTIGDTPEVRALLEKTYPDMAKHGVITQYLNVIKGQKPPAALPMQLQDIVDFVTKESKPPPSFYEVASQFINDPAKPDALKDFAIAFAKDISDPLGIMRMFNTIQGIWQRGVSSGWRDVPYDQWKEPTIKEATDGATPAMRWGIGAGMASAIANSDIRLQHLVSEWSNPLLWYTGGETAAEGEVAVKILKGAEQGAVKDAAELAAKESGKAADEIVAQAENRIAKAVESIAAPDNIIIPETKPAVGQIFDAGVTKDAAGNLVKNENVPYRVIKEGETIPADAIEQNGKIYVKETPAGTVSPTEAAKPQGEVPGGQPAQAEMSLGKIETTADIEKKVSPAMAELDTKITAARTRIDAAKQKGIGQRGAINDPEAKAYYEDHVELASLYIQKGIKTVEEFAAELGEKVDDFIRMVWDDATVAKKESDELKGALGISENAGHIPSGSRILSEAEMKAASGDMVTRIKAARAVLEERQGAVSELRGQQTAAGMAAKEAAGGGLKGFKAAGVAQRGEAEKVFTGLGEAEYDEATIDYIINTPDRVYKENPAIFYKNQKGAYWTVRDAQDGLIKLMNGESLPKAQLEHLEKVYGIEFIKTIKNTKKGLIMDILAIPKSLMAFLDHSFPGRQGWIINSANPELFAKNIKDATASFWSKGYFEALKQRVMNDPNFKIAKAWGVEFTDTGMDRVLREESYPSRIMDKVPGMEQSNRSFTWAGNAQRLDAWNKYVKWLGPDATDAELKGLASFVNKATGRGELGKATVLAEELNTVLFSPKLFASRLQTPLMGITSAIPTRIGKQIGLAPYSKRLQSIYWRNVGTSIGVTITTLGLLKGLSELPGLKDKIYVETDLRSSDIGKAIIGDTHIDLTGGNGQLIYLLARMAAGTRKSGGSNEYDTTAAVELQRYLRYKGAPAASIAMDWAVGKDVTGNTFGTGKYWQGKIPFPLAIRDVYDAINISGLGGIAVAPLTIYGMGVNTYEQRATTEEKRLGALKYSDDQLMEATVKAKEKFMKPGVSDPAGEKAVQKTLDKLATDTYTLSDYRTYLRTAGVADYKNSKLQQYFKECMPLFDKWEKDEAITGSKLRYSAEEKAQAAFWGLDQTKTSFKTKARQKMAELGLAKEAAPWLY